MNAPTTTIYPGASRSGLGGHYFVAFYGGNRDRIARAVAVTIGPGELAAEAVDEAMARAYQRWDRLASYDNPSGWVYRVAVNWATSVLRRRRRAPSSPEAAAELPAMPEPAVARAIAELDVRLRQVVVCRHLLGWSEAETATALRAPVGTVKSRLHRANKHLSARLSHLRTEEQ